MYYARNRRPRQRGAPERVPQRPAKPAAQEFFSALRCHRRVPRIVAMNCLLLSAAVGLLAGVLLAQSTRDVEQRVDALLLRMSLDEKIGQMSQSTATNAAASIAFPR